MTDQKAIELLREAERLYSTYGLVAGHPNAGKWINAVRALLAQEPKAAPKVGQ